MASDIYTMWQTARARCEVLSQPLRNMTVMVWVGSSLAFQAVVANIADAQKLAVELLAVYGDHFEGIVGKLASGLYHVDGTSTNWCKIKNPAYIADGRAPRTLRAPDKLGRQRRLMLHIP
jgi:hypothetical protein